MPHSVPDDRLSRIATHWTMVLAAHGDRVSRADQLRHTLLLRYTGAAYRYLLGAVRDQDRAEELCQEFAVRFLRGDFHRAAPGRGRFRDYLKAALVNLVNDHWRSDAGRPAPLAHDVAAPERALTREQTDDDFLSSWRAELLDRTWLALRESRPNYHAALLMRVENPDMTSQEMADALTAAQSTPVNAALVRKTLERAHTRFAELLIDEVASSLGDDAGRLGDELRELGLLPYCRSAFERRARPA